MKSYFAWLLLAIVSAIAPDCALGQTPATFTVSSNANGATFRVLGDTIRRGDYC